ncbi:MAG TPA: phytochelatin synthase family protein [Xanthobacteraceae bacterium]|nr:phytochelatin synthase family protein [Xanthobacteraceae bacterium]
MRLARRLPAHLLTILLLLAPYGAVRAETLALPDNLTGFSSPAGERLLLDSDARAAYFPLASAFVTQKTQSYCGVASMVMVLNALGVPAPSSPEYAPYTTFTQDNVLDEATEAILPRAVLLKIGMTLDQLGAILAAKQVQAQVHHAGDSSLEAFRQSAVAALGQPGRFVIVNYLRKAIRQETGGHISPLAAYDEQTDRFLILDVARYKYPPVWVTSADLFAAMNTPDSDNNNRTRGYVLVSAPPAP